MKYIISDAACGLLIGLVLFMSRYDTKEEIQQFTDEVFQPAIMGAGLGEDGRPRPGSLMESVARNDRSVAHAMLLCAFRRGVNMLTKKRPDLIEVYVRTYVCSQ